MKHATAAPVSRSSAAPRGAVRTTRVQAKASAGAGNHRRQRYDGYERQADEMARRIMRGETGVARRITPTAPAAYRLPRSPGSPLPADLRREMEKKFGADFRAVRVHVGAEASAAAESHHAEAFASGRDLYFRQGRYAPHTPTGKQLLAHELTHALQQTGRLDAEGLLRVTELQGTGEVQTKRTCPLTSSATIPDFDQVADRHRAASPTDKVLGKKIDQIKRERDEAIKANREENYWETLDTLVRSHPPEYHEATSPTSVRSFIYDCLKLAKRWDGAAFLLIRDWDLQTTFFASDAYEAYPEGAIPDAQADSDANDYLVVFWKHRPFFKDFGPDRFFDATTEFLTGPSRYIQDLDLKGNFSGLVDTELGTRNAPTALIDNELYFLSLHFIREVDRIRIKKTAEFAQAIAGSKSHDQFTPLERAQVAQKLEAWARGLPLDKTYTGEIAALLKAMSDALANTALGAMNFWAVADTIVDAAAQGVVLPEVGDAKAGLADFVKRPELEAFRDNVIAGAEGLFKLETGGNPPSPADYATARDAFVAKIKEKLFERFERPMLRALRSKDKKDIVLSLLYGWMFLRITELIALLKTYNPTDDAALVAKYGAYVPGYAGADMRISHRIKVARFLNGFGFVLQWTELRKTIAPVFNPPKGASTLLAIFSDFTADTDKIEKLTEDFGGGNVITGLEPLTMADIRNFFWLQRSETVAASLKASIDAEKKNPGSQSYGLVKRALDAANALPKPMRYVSRDFYASVRSEDRGYFSRYIRAHPKFVKLVQEQTKNDEPPSTIIPLEFNDGELVVWTLPAAADYDKLVKRFQGIAAFNDLIYTWETLEKGGTPVQSPDLSAIANRPFQDWLRAFNYALHKSYPWLETQENNPKESAEWRQYYDEALEAADPAHKKLSADFLAQQDKTFALLHEASVIDRVKKSDELTKLLGEYDRYDQFTVASDSKFVVYEIPSIVLDKIVEAVPLMLPKNEQPLHQAVLMLELADVMAQKLQDSPRLDVMVGYLALIDPAIDYARNKRDELTPVLTDAEQKDDWVSKRAGTLEALSRLFHALQQQQQLEYGLRAVISGPDKYLIDVQGGYVIKPGEDFIIDGIKYTIVDIKRNFAYYPRHGTEKPKLVDDKDAPLSMSLPLVEIRYGESTTTKILRGSDEELMSQLSIAVTLEAIVRQLNDLAAFMQGAMELTMDIIELIPGPGQALMAARLAMSVLQFIASDEFSVLVDYVTNHPVEALEKFGKEILALLNPGALWEFLFFGNNIFDQLHATKTPPKNSKVPHTITQKLTRVIMRLYNFGAGVLGSLGRLQTHTRWRAEQMQLFVLDHPALNFVVRLIADNIDLVSSLVGEAVTLGTSIDEYREHAAKALKEWPDRVFETVNTLRQLELPDEIIPMADIVEIIVTMVLQRLPTKFRIASEVIMFLLDKFGKKQALMDTIADGVKRIGVDPNIPWRGVRDEYLTQPFHKARNELAGSIFDIFGAIPTNVSTGVAGDFALLTPEQKTRFQSAAVSARADDDFEVASVPADVWGFTAGSSIRNPKPLALPRGDGTPLPRALRGPAEFGYGRDFSHVRLHRDAAAAQFTGSVGAQALAGGSHIYLSSQVNPATQSGQWIVNHELAHVAQQVPAARSVSQPVPVTRGHGLAHDPFAERAASRAADAVSGSMPRPIDPGAFSTRGLQPFGIIDITRRLLDDLAGTADVEHDEEKEEKTGGSTGLKKLPPNIKGQIDKLWETFGDALNTKTTFKSPFDQVKQQIVDHLTNKADSEKPAKAIEDALGDLAIDAVREKKKPASGKEPEKIVYELDIDRFEIALSRFIFAKSGIMIKFKLLSGIFAGAASGAKDAPPSFQTLNVVYVHLPEIHGNSKLWQNATNTVLGGKSHDQYFPRIRSYLESKGPSLGVWQSGSYQLTQSVIDAVDAIIAASQAGTLDKSLLPPPNEYLNPKLPSGAANNIGLRLGTYGDAEQQGQERESHHITQYLLLEYFNNKCDDYKPFPLLKNRATAYPGLKASGSGGSARALTFSAPKAAKSVQISDWEDGRGGKMPAILLATPTHRTGRLHVTSKADDWTQGGAKGSAPDSPAAVVNLKFRDYLLATDSSYVKAHDKSTGADDYTVKGGFGDYVALKNATQPGAVQNVIYTAMQETYHWMRDFMQPRLEDALVTIERKYYNDLGKDKHYEITDTELKAVFAEAVIKNKTEMEKGGWN